MAAKPVKILIVSNSVNDHAYILKHLEKNVFLYSLKCASEISDIIKLLGKNKFDIVLCAEHLTNVDVPSVIAITDKNQAATPVLVVSESATDAAGPLMKYFGAKDYIIKSNIANLIPAIEKFRIHSKTTREIAHELNNLLSVILLQSEVSKNSTKDLSRNLELIKNAGQRATDLTRQLMNLSRKQEVASDATNEMTTERVKGSETIFVVEDQADLRVSLCEALGRTGYTVVEACNGLEALKLIQAYEKPIDLILTDVIMPMMGGRELYEAAKDLQFKAKFIFLSGYTESILFQPGIKFKQVYFLEKPFSKKVLLAKVRSVLDELN